MIAYKEVHNKGSEKGAYHAVLPNEDRRHDVVGSIECLVQWQAHGLDW